MIGRPTVERKIGLNNRTTQALEMRLAGVDHRTIAHELGYSSAHAVAVDIANALDESLKRKDRAAEHLREREVLTLDRLQAAIWNKAVNGDLACMDRVLRIVDRRCKLQGTDAPQKVEVITLDAIEVEISRLERDLGIHDPLQAGL